MRNDHYTTSELIAALRDDRNEIALAAAVRLEELVAAGDQLLAVSNYPLNAYLQWREDGSLWAATALDDHHRNHHIAAINWQQLRQH